MAGLDTVFLRTVINKVLPNLSEMNKDMLEETLESIGVETVADFKFVEESDLLLVLRPIQARKFLAAWKQKCLTPGTCSSSICESKAASASLLCFSTTSSSSSSPESSHSPVVDRVDTFTIPWAKFPEELMQCLERGKRLTPRMRRAMVRIVVRAMAQQSCIDTRSTIVVAKQMVGKYPNSLLDILDGDVIGSGCESLVKQIQNRVANVRRSTTPKITKRKHRSDDSDADEVPILLKASVQDTYGCINWEVKFLPLRETTVSQEQKIKKMKMMSLQADANVEEVKHLMKQTYYTQRKCVNQGENIKCLLEEWPFWFREPGMAVHFKELTGIELKETFSRSMDSKGQRLLNYLRTVRVNKHKKLWQAVTKLKVMKEELSCFPEDVKEMVLLLLSYFDEEEDGMFRYVEDTCVAEDVPVDQFPLTPTIVACGQSCFSSRRFMLSIDQKIVQANIPTFVSALCMMFGSYYCFNIHYPSQLAATLEFLQRCFFSISPERGTKVERTNAGRGPKNRRVLTLIQELSDHQLCNS